MKILVISEKSNAAARIAYMLSDGSQKKRSHDGVPVFHFERGDNEYRVVGLRGHIVKVDYPKELSNWSKVDIKDLVMAEPEKKVTAVKLIKVMKELAKDAQQIIIATDYDREGELIGLETVRLLEGDLSNLSRARFSALTKHEIESAFDSLAEPDEKLAAAAESRQIIDLAWGAALTRIISLAAGTTGQNYLSVGRVQSPTLSLIVDRHQEIEEFVPEPYWLVGGTFERSKQFEGEHESNPFWEKEKADQAVRRAGEVDRGEVKEFKREEKTEYPPPPFNTTMMLMEANKLGMTASRAMRVAEDLYTEGFISYPRTDNTVYPRSLSLKVILEKLKESEFSSEAEELLSQERIRPSRGKTRTTDHPPIHPVAGATKKKLKGDRWKIYELVTRRFMATVAPSA
ncbi:MAG: DNA topoisomerase, partial [Methanomassiliicoccales archaeon]